MSPTIRSAYFGVSGLILAFLAPAVVFGCNPAVPTICQAYNRAEAVFIGTLQKVEEVREPDKPWMIDAHFLVVRTFKGPTKKIEVVRFGAGDCDPEIKKIGGDYFVYKEPPSYQIANRTHEVSRFMQDLEYAETRAKQPPTISIQGFIDDLTETQLAKTSVVITAPDGRSHILSLGNRGTYSFAAGQAGEYTVRISLPSKVLWHSVILNTYSPAVESDVVDYKIQLRPGECDFRTIKFPLDAPR